MTWLRGARCTDPEAMPEMEARPPAENRHGGAPRGERPASWDAPRLTRADPSRLANATTEIVRLSALRPPLLRGWMRMERDQTRAQQRAAGTNNTALFDIVNWDDGQRFASRAAASHASSRTLVSRASPRGPRGARREEKVHETRDPGASRQNRGDIEASCRVASGSRLSFRSASPRCTRPGHETDARLHEPASARRLGMGCKDL